MDDDCGAEKPQFVEKEDVPQVLSVKAGFHIIVWNLKRSQTVCDPVKILTIIWKHQFSNVEGSRQLSAIVL